MSFKCSEWRESSFTCPNQPLHQSPLPPHTPQCPRKTSAPKLPENICSPSQNIQGVSEFGRDFLCSECDTLPSLILGGGQLPNFQFFSVHFNLLAHPPLPLFTEILEVSTPFHLLPPLPPQN